eukprot:COSAG01_NODE_275_length_19669_cov_8.676188_12_plen_238_part_00
MHPWSLLAGGWSHAARARRADSRTVATGETSARSVEAPSRCSALEGRTGSPTSAAPASRAGRAWCGGRGVLFGGRSTEIYLCNVCSCHERLRRNGIRGQAASIPRRSGSLLGWVVTAAARPADHPSADDGGASSREEAPPPAAMWVSRASPSWTRSILAEICLCHACSCQEIEGGNARAGVRSLHAREPRQASALWSLRWPACCRHCCHHIICASSGHHRPCHTRPCTLSLSTTACT